MKRVCALIALLLAAPAARADVTFEQRLAIESVAGSGSGTVLTQTSGLRRREERRLALEGPFASAQPETSQTTIVRLDRGVLDQVFAADSSYREIPLARLLATLRQGTMPGVDPGASLDVTWTVTSSSPGGRDSIAGFEATPSVLTLRGTGIQKGTGQEVEIVLTLELWTAKGVPGAAELRAFDTRYAMAVGMAPGAIEETMSAYGVPRSAMRQLTAARARITGTPLRTVMRVAMPSLSAMMSKLSDSMPGAFGGAPPVSEGPLLTSALEVVRIDGARIPAERLRVPAGFLRKE